MVELSYLFVQSLPPPNPLLLQLLLYATERSPRTIDLLKKHRWISMYLYLLSKIFKKILIILYLPQNKMVNADTFKGGTYVT